VSVVLFGSVARGTYRADSDIDILIIAEGLPRGRMKRVAEFRKVEEKLDHVLTELRTEQVYIDVSPVIKSPEEAEAGSPLFLDMVEDAQILYDRGRFFARRLKRLRERLDALGSKRVWMANAW
jgi:predicted nucleotidyltransferase